MSIHHTLKVGDVIQWRDSTGAIMSADLVTKIDASNLDLPRTFLKPIPNSGPHWDENDSDGDWFPLTINISTSTVIRSELARLIYG